MERKVTLTKAIRRIRKLLESGRSIDHPDYSVKILKIAREVQRLSGLVASKGLKLQTAVGLVGKPSRFWEELSKLKKEKD